MLIRKQNNVSLYLKIILPLISGILLGLAFHPGVTQFFAFVAFIPLFFIVENQLNEKRPNVFVFLFFNLWTAFFIWHLIALWWTVNSSASGFFIISALDSILYAIVSYSAIIFFRKLSFSFILLAFTLFWLSFEFIQHRWGIEYPFLSLGNTFSDNINLIQWYEYSGILGGSLWILIVNALMYKLILQLMVVERSRNDKRFAILRMLRIRSATFCFLGIERRRNGKLIIIFLLIVSILPVYISNFLYEKSYENNTKIGVAIIQACIDPYTEKFDAKKQAGHLDAMLNLAEEANDSIDFYVFPETAITEGVFESEINESQHIKRIRKFIHKRKKAKFLTGIYTFRKVDSFQNNKPGVRKKDGDEIYYRSYNSVALIDRDSIVRFYHKEKLLAGVERPVISSINNLILNFVYDFGGNYGILSCDNDKRLFNYNDLTFSTPICWEAVFGNYFRELAMSGADFFIIVSNDSWWGDTPGHKMLHNISRLRAIECRCPIARCANSGISAFINVKGEVNNYLSYGSKAVLTGGLHLSNKQTFYTKNGDLIGIYSIMLSVFLIIFRIFKVR